MNYTDDDFENLSWHDCHLWGIDFRVGDPEVGDWTSDLALDIDFIVEWLCGVPSETRFRVAPATLVFHGVTDPRIVIDWGFSDLQVSPPLPAIDRIEREPIRRQKVDLDRPYYRWRVLLHGPKAGEITFGATGMTQILRAEPVVSEQQHLSLEVRRPWTAR